MHVFIKEKIDQLYVLANQSPTLDEGLIVAGRQAYYEEAKRYLREYKHEMHIIMKENKEFDKEESMSALISPIVAKYR